MVKIVILSFLCMGLVYGQEQETAADVAEKQNQARMNEESKQLEIEDVRAQQKGRFAVYALRKDRTEKQANVANKTKAASDVLIFERMVLSTIEAYRDAYREQGWKEEWIKDKQELKSLELLLDKSLRDPKK